MGLQADADRIEGSTSFKVEGETGAFTKTSYLHAIKKDGVESKHQVGQTK